MPVQELLIETLEFYRRNLYIWNLQNAELVKVLDAHFGRIISLEPLTIGNWNSVGILFSSYIF